MSGVVVHPFLQNCNHVIVRSVEGLRRSHHGAQGFPTLGVRIAKLLTRLMNQPAATSTIAVHVLRRAEQAISQLGGITSNQGMQS